MRTIDVDEAIINFGFEWDDIPPTREEFVRFLKKQPTVDAVPVVRCRECKYCGDGMNMFDFACRQFSELFDAPCNYNDICDYMHERDEYFCPNCDKWAVWQCWKKYFELKYDDIYGK